MRGKASAACCTQRIRRAFLFNIVFSLLFVLARSANASPDDQAGRAIERDIGSEVQGFQQGIRPFPAAKPSTPQIVLPEEAPVAAGPAEKSFFVKEIKLVGAQKIPAKEFKPLLEKYKAKEVTIGQLQAVAKRITQYYRQKGFVTSMAFVPPQKIDTKNPIATIQVIEGKLGAFEIAGNRFFNTAWMLRYMSQKPGDVIDYNTLQKELLSLNTNTDRQVKAVLMPGKVPETTDILLKVDDKLPLHFAHSFDNTGTRLSGRLRQGMQFRNSNFLGRDDTLFSSVNISEHGDLVGESVQYTYPLSPTGGRINASYSHSDVELGKELRPSEVKGGANVFGIGYSHPVFDSSRWTLDLDSGFDMKEIWSTVNGQDNSRDHLRVAHFGPNFMMRDSWGTTSVRDNFIFGIPSFLGGNVKADSRSNRVGAGGQFFINEINASRGQRFFFDSVVLARFQSQFTKYLVVSTQQFRAGGADTVRGYPEGDSLGDYGFLQSTEWRIPPYFLPKDYKLPGTSQSLYDSVQLVLFADMAKTYLRRPSFTQESSKFLVGVGGGIRVELPNQVSARSDWGWPIGDRAEITDGTEVRVHFSITTQLPNLEDIGKTIVPVRPGRRKV